MLSYSANKQGDKLINISKISPQMTATDTQGEFKINVQGEWFYFTDGASRALYEAIREIDGGVIVKRSNDFPIMNAFMDASALDLSETQIYSLQEIEEQSLISDLQSTAKEIIQETKVLQPLIQPVIVQQSEPMQTYAGAIATNVFSEKISIAEREINRIVRTPLEANPANNFQLNMWYWNDLPRALEDDLNKRPPLWVIARPEVQITPIEYADNKPTCFTAMGQFIIQAFGEYFENSVYETANAIMELLLVENEISGNISSLNHSDNGWDSSVNIATTVISYTLTYDIEN